ncbi:MAG: hypothetical protein EPN85_13580 [Bacteroidetes bacterium]|nr:MAG: hypothetical protein EPN85_13580 [Bacteroidota bacterium]
MPFTDIIQKHFTAAEQTQYNSLMTQLEALLQPKLQNLDEDENKKYGVINEQNKLLVNKVRDYHNTQSALSSPDINWPEYDLDGTDRLFLETAATRMEALTTAMLETKRLHDYDNYQNALLDYKYTQYKMETSPGSGYDSKAADLKQFFPGTGGGTPPVPPTPA